MSITPEDGWENQPQQVTEQKPDSIERVQTVYPSQPTYLPISYQVICKICDRGMLMPKRVFRMSGPVVAIGFVLLVPSILGICLSGLMFLGVNAHARHDEITNKDETSHSFQSDYDANFRRSCAKGVKQKDQEMGYYASQQLIEQYCECALSTFKETNSVTTASQTCLQQAKDGTLEQVGQDVDALYSSDTVTRNPDSAGANLSHVIGSGFSVAIGVGSFVGGLLGWLLVMRKKVLQCNVCGAVVNAS
jgi:hypothetical protein